MSKEESIDIITIDDDGLKVRKLEEAIKDIDWGDRLLDLHLDGASRPSWPDLVNQRLDALEENLKKMLHNINFLKEHASRLDELNTELLAKLKEG